MFEQWVDSGAESDHLPICLEIRKQAKQPASPFKLCFAWIKNEEVTQIIQSNWFPQQAENGTRVAVHFTQNLLKIKKLLKDWTTTKKAQDEQAINQIEEDLKEIQNKDGGGFLT